MKPLLVMILILPLAVWLMAGYLSTAVVDRQEEHILVLETKNGFVPRRTSPESIPPPDGSVLIGGHTCRLRTLYRQIAVSLLLRHLGTFHQPVH